MPAFCLKNSITFGVPTRHLPSEKTKGTAISFVFSAQTFAASRISAAYDGLEIEL